VLRVFVLLLIIAQAKWYSGGQLQFKVSFCGVVINTEPADFNKPSWQDVHGKVAQELGDQSSVTTILFQT
jgi:hypothetical protein